MKKIKSVFFGTPDFSVPCLELLHNHPNIDLQYVISMPDRKAGRGMELKSPAVIEYAKKNKIPFFQTENINQEEAFLEKLKKNDIDLFIVLAFAQFLKQPVLDLPQLGCFNIHTSLLPKYRGAAPIQYALLNGDSTTGVSIQKMVKKMDAGDIVHFQEINIAKNETGGQLYTRLKFTAALALNDFIPKIINNKNIQLQKQNETHVSFAPALKKTDGFLDFEKMSYEDIFNKIRALDPWPGTYCYLNKKRLKVFAIEKSHTKLQAGQVTIQNNMLEVGTTNGAIRLHSLQLEGKKPCSDIELLNGLRDKITINSKE